jgi:hypothetical protein
MKKHVRSVTVIGASLALILCLVALGACTISAGGGGTSVGGSGNVTTEDRAVSGVTGVSLATFGDLTIELGDQESLRVEAEDNLLQYLKTNVRGGVLVIEEEPDVDLQPKKPIRYHLTVKTLESIDVTSSGNVTAPALKAGHFAVRESSSGDVDLVALEADSLEVALSSSGDLKIGGGQLGSQEIKLSSSGDYRAGDVRSASAGVDLTSSGDATIWVTDRLEAKLSSSGDLSYYGSPRADVNESSSGRARGLGEK